MLAFRHRLSTCAFSHFSNLFCSSCFSPTALQNSSSVMSHQLPRAVSHRSYSPTYLSSFASLQDVNNASPRRIVHVFIVFTMDGKAAVAPTEH